MGKTTEAYDITLIRPPAVEAFDLQQLQLLSLWA